MHNRLNNFIMIITTGTNYARYHTIGAIESDIALMNRPNEPINNCLRLKFISLHMALERNNHALV
jgi:hypothetical protein